MYMNERSNIVFSSNVEVMKSASTLELDTAFCRKVKDYYALKKLYQICGCSTNSYRYMFSREQINILCPDILTYGFTPRVENEEIRRKNEEKDQEYGYDYYQKNGRIPLNELIDEYELNYGKSIWDNENWFATVNINGNTEPEKFGIYEKKVTQKGTVLPTGGGSLFSTFVKKEIERINSDNTYLYVINRCRRKSWWSGKRR